MGMVVKTNMMAINANNALNRNNSTVAKNVEKLSTGMRINRAADDASGLAISEKMKAQIKALDTASANAEDGISLIQTAEGYMEEVHDMLNRIVELAEKSANGTYETTKDANGNHVAAAAEDFSVDGKATGVDRQALQDEVNQLCAEIDRIATTANFNGLKLMDGTMDTNNATQATVKVSMKDTDGVFTIEKVEAGDAAPAGAALRLQIGETSTASDRLSVNIRSFKTEALFAKAAGSLTEDGAFDTAYKSADNKFLVAANDSVSENAAGVTLNISNQTSAAKVAENVRDTINEVSTQRAKLGAQQNRLEYTINNLDTASENITAANSRIRDTDMAKEMMAYTQGNVLTQAAQAMLAQANQAPQGVLQLLQ